MDKELIIAKIRRWQAELREIIEQLNDEGKGGPILEILKKREEEIQELIEAIRDKSFIPRGDVSFEPGTVMEEIVEKVKKVKEGVRRLKELKKEKKKILEELEQG
jgi:DNA repair exonuclease SbcCD ATPase subunit